MQRRDFTKNISGLLLASSFAPSTLLATNDMASSKQLTPLQKGDTIGLISPGSYLSDEGLAKAIEMIEGLGFKTKLSTNIRAKYGFVAGTDEQRLADIHQMYADKTVKAIWCIRGGYGTTRLLPYLDYKLIKKNPKILIGYSDITALLNAIYCETGIIGLHGPVGASDMPPYTQTHLEAMITGQQNQFVIEPASENLANEDNAYSITTIHPGVAQGKLIGGNLSLLSAMCGTDHEPNFSKKIVFIEDVGEKPYRIDRMLTQLRQSKTFKKAAGIALGIFADCEAPANSDSLSLQQTLEDRLADLNIPTIYGLSFGHISHQCTLPIGVEAVLDTHKKTITILDNF